MNIPVGGNFKNDLAFSNIAPVQDLIVQSYSCGNNVMTHFSRKDNTHANEYIFNYVCDRSSKADKKNCRQISNSKEPPKCFDKEKLTDVRYFQDFRGDRYDYTCCKYF